MIDKYMILVGGGMLLVSSLRDGALCMWAVWKNTRRPSDVWRVLRPCHWPTTALRSQVCL